MSARKGNEVPEVSVVMPCYNCAATVRESIRSVQAQSWPDWELLVVDDCSLDDSARVVEELAAEDKRIVLIRQPQNAGPAAARNTGIDRAHGRYLSFLDSDDRWMPEFLRSMLTFLREGDRAFVFAAYEIVSEAGVRLDVHYVPPVVTRAELLKSNVIGCLATMFDTQKLGKMYMERVGHEDFTLWLKLLRKCGKAYGLNRILASYRVGQGTVSRNKWRAAGFQWRIYREVEHLLLPVALWYFLHYAWRGFWKNRKTF